jgi:putative ABC transport system ATP-binding protein
MSEGRPIIEVIDVVKTFEGGRVRALDGVSLTVDAGEFVAIVGPSGCGKSTLLNLIGALDLPDSGDLHVAGHDLDEREDLNGFRSRKIGLVFQLDNLLPGLTAVENVEAPMFGVMRGRRHRRERAVELLDLVGIADRAGTRPPLLSGGERQRVAIARALANHPVVLLADEPTGRLDSTTSDRVMDLLEGLRRDTGVTLIVVSHDPAVAARADRVIRMLDGRVLPSADDQQRSATGDPI